MRFQKHLRDENLMFAFKAENVASTVHETGISFANEALSVGSGCGKVVGVGWGWGVGGGGGVGAII